MIVCVFFLVVQKKNADKKAHPHPQQTKKETKECGLAHGVRCTPVPCGASFPNVHIDHVESYS